MAYQTSILRSLYASNCSRVPSSRSASSHPNNQIYRSSEAKEVEGMDRAPIDTTIDPELSNPVGRAISHTDTQVGSIRSPSQRVLKSWVARSDGFTWNLYTACMGTGGVGILIVSNVIS